MESECVHSFVNSSDENSSTGLGIRITTVMTRNGDNNNTNRIHNDWPSVDALRRQAADPPAPLGGPQACPRPLLPSGLGSKLLSKHLYTYIYMVPPNPYPISLPISLLSGPPCVFRVYEHPYIYCNINARKDYVGCYCIVVL